MDLVTARRSTAELKSQYQNKFCLLFIFYLVLWSLSTVAFGLPSVTLRNRRLDVVAAEELLEVEDRERVTLVKREELAEGAVGLDRLLVHQVVGARVRHHALRDRRAADLRVLRLGEEAAELVADLDGLREDAGLGLRTGNGVRLALAAAIGLLDDTGRLLLNDLESSGGGARGRLERTELLVELRDRLLERGTDVLLDNGVRGRGGDRRRRRNLNNGGGNRGRRLRGLRGLRRLRGDGRGRNGLNRDSNSGGNGLSGLRGLRRRGLGGNGGAHFGRVGGTNCGHLTRVLIPGV